MLSSALPGCGAWAGSWVRNNCVWVWGFFPFELPERFIYCLLNEIGNLQGWGEAKETGQGAKKKKKRQKWIWLHSFLGSERCCEPGELTGRLLEALVGFAHLGQTAPVDPGHHWTQLWRVLKSKVPPSVPRVTAQRSAQLQFFFKKRGFSS